MTEKEFQQTVVDMARLLGWRECWPWPRFIDKGGYGRLRTGGRTTPVAYAHRVSFELHTGPIPDGLELDHLCGNRSCFNPTHVEAVTHAENVSRALKRETCKRGHSLADAHRDSQGRVRNCRTCRQEKRKAGLWK